MAGYGKILTRIAKSTISTTPLTNSGTTVSDRLATVMIRSAMPSRCSAAVTPKTIDRGMMMMSAMKASWIDAQSRCMVSEKTGTSRLYDVPQCNTRKPPSQLPYRVSRGRS